MKSYQLHELFKLSWKELTTQEMVQVIVAREKMRQCKAENLTKAYGHWSIMMLRALRKNKYLVAKINIKQAVDCVNAITFFNKPWFHFPEVEGWQKPDEYLKNCSFIHMVFADSLFSKYLIQDYIDKRAHPSQYPSVMSESYLNDMIGVLYSEKIDESKIEETGKAIAKVLTDEVRMIIFHSYVNVKQFIINNSPFLFPQPDEEEESYTAKMPVDSEPMWQALLFDLAETPAYQGMHNAKNAPLYEVLNYLEKKSKEAHEKKHKPV